MWGAREAPRQDGVGISCQRLLRRLPRKTSRPNEGSLTTRGGALAGTKFWGRPQDIDAGSQVREQRVVCAHCCV